MRALARTLECAFVCAVGLAAIYLLAGCGPTRPACAPGVAQTIEAEYVAKALEACRGYTYDDCPELPRLRAEADVKRAAYVECAP